MEDESKFHPPPTSKLSLLVYQTKQTIAFAYGFMASFVICILLTLLYDPYGQHSPSSSSSPSWYSKDASHRLFPNSSSHQDNSSFSLCLPQNGTQPTKSNDTGFYGQISESYVEGFEDQQNITSSNSTRKSNGVGELLSVNSTGIVVAMNQSSEGQIFESSSMVNQEDIGGLEDQQNNITNSNSTRKSNGVGELLSVNSTGIVVVTNQSSKGQILEPSSMVIQEDIGGLKDQQNITNSTSADIVSADIVSADNISANYSNGIELHEYEAMLKCDFYDGKWVRDFSYPLYPHGLCPYSHKAFNCFRNGRPDSGYESYRWQPKHCNIQRLKGENILELLRGKRLVFVGDSLNRNMWESLVCIMTMSLKDQSRVVTSYGRHVFKDYNCSVEFFWAAFLVQEWEITNHDGSKKKSLRLDVMDINADKYKDADILIFNSGHWYTNEKTSNGRNYFQERYRIHRKLDVIEAYRRAIITWRKWVEANVNPMKTQVFFRGYSATHFGGGKWNSGGRCDQQTEPIKKEKFLSQYPIKMKILDSVMKDMKIPVHYMNITRLTNYRKDAHPASYRTRNLTEEERLNPLRFQDCSHWCLPGVPDTWNEILFAQILMKFYKKN